MANTVTLSKEYFDTLLRRTQLQAEGITVPQHEYDRLLQTTQNYDRLRAALLKGGIDATTLDVLVNETSDDTAAPENTAQPPSVLKPSPKTWSAQATPFIPRLREQKISTAPTRLQSETGNDKEWHRATPKTTSYDDFQELNYTCASPEQVMTNHQEPYGQDENYEQDEEDSYAINREDRCVVLKGISPFTTMADVLAVVRGGAVLNIYLRPQQRSAHVAFVDPNAAEKFLIHAKRTDLYIKGKRIEVFFDDREYFLPDYLARRIYNNGATRNLVVRFAKADMTEESIRDDLEHIHRLEVVRCHFEFGHAWISLNSVQQAVTARSCMVSRFKYKGCRIEFYPDECAEPPPPFVKRQPQSQSATLRRKKSTSHFRNRFATLSVDEENRSVVGAGSPGLFPV